MSEELFELTIAGVILLFCVIMLTVIVYLVNKRNRHIEKINRAIILALKETRRTHPHFSFERVRRIVEEGATCGDGLRDEEIRSAYDKGMGEKK